MKKISVIFFFIGLLVTQIKAQSVSVEKSIYGVQLGVPPLSIYNESRLTNLIALRSQISFGLVYEMSLGESYWDIYPILNVEPRFYYSLPRRSVKGKRIDGNCGDYWALSLSYEPGWEFKSKELNVFPEINIIPTWGFKRNVGRYFIFEMCFGLGYGWVYEDYYYYDFFGNIGHYHETVDQFKVRMNFSIGYRF